MKMTIDTTFYLQLTTKAAQLEQLQKDFDDCIVKLRGQIADAQYDRELLARMVINHMPGFERWLLEQDNSSTMTDLRPGLGYGGTGSVEDKTDLQLALAWAEHKERTA